VTTQKTINFTPEAKADLKEALDYSAREFGVAQAEIYFQKISHRLNLLLHYPELGIKKDEIRKGYRALVCESHVAYYRIFGDEIRVARLLHQQMDSRRHIH
jgi:toxin ParE1/3/4